MTTRNQRKRRVRQSIAVFFTTLFLLVAAMIMTVDADDERGAQIADTGKKVELIRADDMPEIPIKEIPAAEYADINDIPRVCLGEFTVTYYCSCERCCGKSDGITATGTTVYAGLSAAVDPSVIPLGTLFYVEIDGVEHMYCADDTGGGIKGNRLDIYVSSHEEALKLGVKTATVYIWEDSK